MLDKGLENSDLINRLLVDMKNPDTSDEAIDSLTDLKKEGGIPEGRLNEVVNALYSISRNSELKENFRIATTLNSLAEHDEIPEDLSYKAIDVFLGGMNSSNSDEKKLSMDGIYYLAMHNKIHENISDELIKILYQNKNNINLEIKLIFSELAKHGKISEKMKDQAMDVFLDGLEADNMVVNKGSLDGIRFLATHDIISRISKFNMKRVMKALGKFYNEVDKIDFAEKNEFQCCIINTVDAIICAKCDLPKDFINYVAKIFIFAAKSGNERIVPDAVKALNNLGLSGREIFEGNFRDMIQIICLPENKNDKTIKCISYIGQWRWKLVPADLLSRVVGIIIEGVREGKEYYMSAISNFAEGKRIPEDKIEEVLEVILIKLMSDKFNQYNVNSTLYITAFLGIIKGRESVYDREDVINALDKVIETADHLYNRCKKRNDRAEYPGYGKEAKEIKDNISAYVRSQGVNIGFMCETNRIAFSSFQGDVLLPAPSSSSNSSAGYLLFSSFLAQANGDAAAPPPLISHTRSNIGDLPAAKRVKVKDESSPGMGLG